MKTPHHCRHAASEAGDSWLQLTVSFYVLLAILSKTHTKQDVARPSMSKQGKLQVMMSNDVHQHGKRVLSPTFVLNLLLVGILSKAMNMSFSFLQNSKPHSKIPEAKGATSSTSHVLNCFSSTWPCFLSICKAVLYTPRRILPLALGNSTTFSYFVSVSLHKTHIFLPVNSSHFI